MESKEDALFREGVRLFNERRYWHAHEVWETVWRSCPDAERRFYQGLIQAAASLYHACNGNVAGAAHVGGAALRKLAEYPTPYRGVDLTMFRQALEDCLSMTNSFVGWSERLPQIVLLSSSEPS